MKEIEVRDQVSLPLRRCLQLTVHGIRYRLFRSAVTVVIVSLAVAFLMMMLSTSYIDKEVAVDARERTADRRLLTEWVDKLTVPMTGEVLAQRLAALEPGSGPWQEFLGWGGLTEAELTRLTSLAIRQGRYLRYLARLDPGQRSALVGTRQGEAAVDFLDTPERIQAFAEKVRSYKPSFFVDDCAGWLAGLVNGRNAAKAQREKLIAEHTKAVRGLAAELGDRSYLDLLSRAGAAEGDPVARLRKYGYHLGHDELEALRTEAELELDARRVLELLRDQNMRSYFADEAGVEVQEVIPRHVFKHAARARRARRVLAEIGKTRANARGKIDGLKAALKDLTGLLAKSPDQIARVCAKRQNDPAAHPEVAGWLLGLSGRDSIRRAMSLRLKKKLPLVRPEDAIEIGATAEGAEWLLEQVRIAAREVPVEIIDREQRILPPLGLTAERIAEVSAARLEQDRLSDVLSDLQAVGEEGWLGFDRRTGWLIVISFMVCVVGVANAMLMSVTERFREIATMKCLGALDSFIMVIFVMESSLQGVAGGMIGVVIGALLGAVRSLWGFGMLALANVPGTVLLCSAGGCLVAGVVLAAMAAVYPAWVAARLAPMEAMRIE
ncbi:MAG: ABC transporter permease [Planctomycetota bacterium]|jgi:hypothetical protein